MRGRAGILALALLAACSDPREAELTLELAKLQETRTSRHSVAQLAAEADAAEAGLVQLRGEIESLRQQALEAEALARAAEAAYQRELDRNAALNTAIQEGQVRLQEKTVREAALGQEVELARARARTFKDQAAVLVKELRPDDPDWAREMRIRTLREFLASVGQAWPRDPVLSGIARVALPPDLREATRLGAEQAARVRDRVTEVYGLGDEASAAGPPAVAAEPPDQS